MHLVLPRRPASRVAVFLCLSFLAGLARVAGADAVHADLPFLSPIFGDHMVLQHGKPNTFWGWTKPGTAVVVTIKDQSGRGVAAADGRWQARLDVPPVGENCVVKIDSEQQHVELHDVLVGDVWLCGGQSNMQFGLPGVVNGAAEVAAANHPNIRLFNVPAHSAYNPVQTTGGAWKVCTPQSVGEGGGFSAVAYYFACRVQADTGVPIGLIEDCLGGTPAESWMADGTLHALKDFAPALAEIDRLRAAHAPEYGNYIMHWFDDYDPGIRGSGWFDPAFDDQGWKTVHLPGAFAELGLADVPSVVWFRREITLPDPLPEGRVMLSLGVVEQMDTAYLNGHWVGASSWVENPRLYRVPPGVLKPGRNQITLRIFKRKSAEAFLSKPDVLQIKLPDGSGVPLTGEWKAAVSVDARPPHPMPLGFENYPVMPGVLYTGMIEPLEPFAIAGALWYQGEANSRRAFQYRTLLPAMIRDWRAGFQQGDFPFYIAELPRFQPHRAAPASDDWAELREAQALTAAHVPNSGVAVTIDTGEADNIHPKEKKPVGERLALLALARYYGKKVVDSGPTFHGVTKNGHELRIAFDHTDGGLQVHGDKLGEFSIAGADHKWVWANARLDGDTVVVSAPGVPEPEAVRYAWQQNPEATLFNGAGLPAAPFRSDDWPGVTDQRGGW